VAMRAASSLVVMPPVPTPEEPTLIVPGVDLNAGFSGTQPARTASPAPVVRVGTVAVVEGQRVEPGQVLVTLDAPALDAALGLARADAAVAAAQPPFLDQKIADADSTRRDLVAKKADVVKALDDLTAKRATVVTAIATLTSKQAQLASTIATLVAKRPTVAAAVDTLTGKLAQADAAVTQLTAQRDQLTAAIAALTAQGVPADDPRLTQARAGLAQVTAALAQATAGRAQLAAALTQAKAGLAQLDAGLAQARAAQPQLAAALTQATSGLAQLDAGKAKARDGLAKINDGLAQLDDGVRALHNARTLAALGASAAGLQVQRAEQSRALASVVAPEAGVIVTIAHPGDVVAPGATLAVLRPDRTPTVTTALAPDKAVLACPGAAAVVTTDAGQAYPATVERIGVRADYPPTTLATDEVHLTRAVPVTLALSGAAPPPGLCVDVVITPCQAQK
ncbi:MAG TPA: biotin/lipoyl-binding protein, partial [Arachnia sp.]|nr:biotin/lipoyl-binding protein [Arachnia sp.]